MADNTLDALMMKILARGVVHLRGRLNMPRLVNSDMANEAAQPGSTIDVKIPVAQTATAVAPSNTPPNPDAATPTTVQVPLDQWYKTNFKLSDKDQKDINAQGDFLPMQTIESIDALAVNVNRYLMSLYKPIYGYTGTAGTTPFGTPGVEDATLLRAVLNKQKCPKTMRRCVVDFDADAKMLALAAFSDAEKIASNQVKIEGEIGRKYGIDWYSDDDVPTHTAGTITTGLIAKASTAQAVGDKTIVCTTAASTGACALKEGDIITFAGDEQTYVLTADATQASAATDVTLAIEPGLKVALAGSEAVTVKASHVVNLAFHPNAFAFAMRRLEDTVIGSGNLVRAIRDPLTGIVLRLEISRQYKQTMWEFDVLYGAKLVRPELASRLAG